MLLLYSFEYFDKDRSNSLNYDEILCALQHAGAPQHTAHSTVQHLQCQAESDYCLVCAGETSAFNGHPLAVVLMCVQG
jgi:galactose-1-phosphate uridylyltransferase